MKHPIITSGIVNAKRGLAGGWLGFSGLMLLPAVILMVVFVFKPAVSAVEVCMESWSGFSPKAEYVGLMNFRHMFTDDVFWYALKNSVIWMIVGGAGTFIFAFLLSMGLQDPRLRAKKFFQTIIIFPMFISAVGVAILWKELYDPTAGMINLLGSVFGLTDPANGSPAWLDPAHGIYPFLLVGVWSGIGGQVILILAGMRRIPQNLYEAAYVDGASEGTCFFRISLPLMRDIIRIIVVLWIIESLQVFGLVQGLMGDSIEPKLHVVSTYIYVMAFNARSNMYMMGQATAMAVVLVVITLLLVGVLLLAYRLVYGKSKLEY